jgi:hypothetical protein
MRLDCSDSRYKRVLRAAAPRNTPHRFNAEPTTMNMRNRVVVAVLVLGASLRVPAAQAKQPGPAELNEAQRRFQRATELFEENNLPGALAEFRKAYSLAPNYRVLYNIGQLCFLMQDNPCAYGAFSSYLAQGGGEIPDKRRQEVQRDLARLQARVAKLRILVDRPGAEVTVDDVAVGTTPLAEPVLVAAGRPRVRATLEGYIPATQVIEVAAMETARVELHMVPAPSATSREDGPGDGPRRLPEQAASPRPPVDPIASPPPDVTREAPPPSESSSGAMTAAGVTLGVIGLAAVAGGGFSSFKVRSLERELENAKLGEFDAARLASQRSTAQRYERWQWIGYGVGGASLVAATVLLMMDSGDGGDGGGAQARGPRLYGSIGAGGAVELGLGARF